MNTQSTMNCPDPHCFAAGGTVWCPNDMRVGVASVVGVSRNLNQRKMERPVLLRGQLGGQTCRAILAHEGSTIQSGHWFAFVLQRGEWLRVDTLRPRPIAENPLLNQKYGGSSVRQSNYTLDCFFFS